MYYDDFLDECEEYPTPKTFFGKKYKYQPTRLTAMNSSLIVIDDVVQPTKSCQEKEKETMNENQGKVNYLSSRLWNAYRNKNNELAKHFGVDFERPDDILDAFKRIREGKFKIPSEEALKERFEDSSIGYIDSCDFYHAFDWRTKEEDREGYKAALALLDRARTETEDLIQVGTPEQGLEALRKFEAQKFH